ncbi:MAG: lysostaphin resistance A-like protein [Xenococcaceae cyanobacterium]
MTIKRWILILLTIVALIPVVFSLGESLSQPQIQARLQLYQTNLILHASEFQIDKIDGEGENSREALTVRNALIGNDPYLTAQKQYQEARQVAQTSRSNLQAQLQKLFSEDTAKPEGQIFPVAQAGVSQQQQQLQQEIGEVEKFIDKLDLKLGILQAQRGETDTALKTWNDLIARFQEESSQEVIPKTAAVLSGLWSQPPVKKQDAESQIQENLDGWFRYRALKQLYQLQERPDELLTLQAKEQQIAAQAMFKLALIGGIPLLGGILGIGLLIFLLAQLLIKRERSLLASNSGMSWETPWDAEIIWQVLIVGFFFIGQILLPLLFSLSGLELTDLSLRFKAFYVLVSYLLMAGGGLLVLYVSVKPFLPLPSDWFHFKWLSNWIVWGVGGYLVALPLVVVVSLINQQLWHGQGGSNPIIFLALQAQDQVALAIFFFTASVAAPVFEEIIFRGFLLPSLTRYLPVWSAIFASSLIFSIAHLSFSEVLPLTTLGIVLGFIYTRSRNLLAPILLHSLWNSGTLLSIFVLGSGAG